MGPAQVGRAGWAVLGGRRYTGVTVAVGNPHLVCVVTKALSGIDLTEPPEVDAAAFPGRGKCRGRAVTGDHAIERCFEAGRTETLAGGTGAVAAATGAAAATAEWPGGAGRTWAVDVPGGRLAVAPSTTASLLTGPAVIVAEGEISASWLADQLVASATA
jgi:diaminopimelate epimerase